MRSSINSPFPWGSYHLCFMDQRFWSVRTNNLFESAQKEEKNKRQSMGRILPVTKEDTNPPEWQGPDLNYPATRFRVVLPFLLIPQNSPQPTQNQREKMLRLFSVISDWILCAWNEEPRSVAMATWNT